MGKWRSDSSPCRHTKCGVVAVVVLTELDGLMIVLQLPLVCSAIVISQSVLKHNMKINDSSSGEIEIIYNVYPLTSQKRH